MSKSSCRLFEDDKLKTVTLCQELEFVSDDISLLSWMIVFKNFYGDKED